MKMNVTNLNMKWKHVYENMIRCYIMIMMQQCLKKRSSYKTIAAWVEADFMPINWNPFYDTYDINQKTSIHNINVTLQLVSAQKDAYAREL